MLLVFFFVMLVFFFVVLVFFFVMLVVGCVLRIPNTHKSQVSDRKKQQAQASTITPIT